MKILYLNPAAQLGGAERMLLDVMASLRDVLPPWSSMHLVALADGPLIDEAKRLGVQARVVAMPGSIAGLGDSGARSDASGGISKLIMLARSLVAAPALIGFACRLRRVIAEIQPDVIHSNGFKTHVLSRLIASAAPRAATVWHVHDLISQRPLVRRVLHRFAGQVSVAVAISQAVASDLGTVLPRLNVRVIVNAIDTDHFSPGTGDTQMLDRLAGFAPAPGAQIVRIGLVATYARWKGHDVFIEAAARAIAASPIPIRCYIVGGPIYQTAGSQFTRPELERLALDRGVRDQVGFIDFQEDPAPIYRALDIVVHASTRPEPFGRTIAEAMACGRAVIAAEAGGAREIIGDGSAAVAVAPCDARQLADAMLRLSADGAFRERIARQARRVATERFERSRLGREFLPIYEQVVGPSLGSSLVQ